MTDRRRRQFIERRRLPRLEALESRQLLSVTAWTQYAGDDQHSAQSAVAAQSLDVIHWETPVDSAPVYIDNDLFIHYGTPLVTAGNTVIVPERNESTGGYDVNAFDGATGALKWTQTEAEDYVAPPHDWIPSYSPALAPIGGNYRLYFPGPDGTIFDRDSPDAIGSVTPGQIAFYGGSYNPADFSDVRVNSPLTTDSQGNLYFTYEATGNNPLGLQGGIVRIAPDGTATYKDVGTPAINSAPALSPDGSKLYIVIGSKMYEYDSTTLNPLANTPLVGGIAHPDSSASPTVGPDGDVYFGTWTYSDDDRGYLDHFSADLSTTYTTGSFGWDDTVSIVPTSMVPSYTGNSPYLLMTKYNDYAGEGGTGINEIAILDPDTINPHDPITGQPSMATVLAIAGVTPDPEFLGNPNAVREWCINNAVVDPATHSIYANSEDGWLYQWDTTTNTFTQRIQLTSGVGEAYTPTVIGVDGTVYAINNAILFAIGNTPTVSINSVSVVEGNSGITNALFTVSLSSSTTQQVTVAFNTADGTATAGSDYQATSGTLTFAPATTSSGGTTLQTITVPVNGDTLFEPDETFYVNLTDPAGATLANSQGTGTIENDDADSSDVVVTASTPAPNPAMSGTNYTYTITVTNNGPSTATNVVVTDTVAPSLISYMIASGTGSVAGNQATVFSIAPSASATIVVVKQADSLWENLTDQIHAVADETDSVPANNSATVVESVLEHISTIAATHLFYAGSTRFDAVNNGATFSDDNAIAPDKTAYIANGANATFSSVSSYTKGINGIMVDVALIHGTFSVNDFIFKAGDNNSPNLWATTVAPQIVTTRAGKGVGGSDRVELIWTSGAVTKSKWLEVIVKGDDSLGGSDSNTNLASSYVFFFGSAPGDTGAADTTRFTVDGNDGAAVLNDPHSITNRATITDKQDFNRDSLVDGNDGAVVLNNGTSITTGLIFLKVAAAGPFAPESSPEVGTATLSAKTNSAPSGDDQVVSALAASSKGGTNWASSGSPPGATIWQGAFPSSALTDAAIEDSIAAPASPDHALVAAAEDLARELSMGDELFEPHLVDWRLK